MTAAVRPARAEDLVPLAARLAPLELFVRYGMTAAKLAARWEDALRSTDGLLVAEEEGAPVGICWFLRRGTFSSGAYLRTIAIAPGAHGRGLGLALLRAYEQGAGDPPGGWFLLASDFNTGAHRFYARHGYREVGRLPEFAAPGISEVIFWKPRGP